MYTLKKIPGILAICVMFTACKDKDKFIIEGTFTNAVPQSKVYLFGLKDANATALDSTVFSEKGEFKFSHATPGTDFFRVSADTKEYLIIAKNGDDVKITADLTDANAAYNISGAMEADKLQELNTIQNQYGGRIAQIQAEFNEAAEAQPAERSKILEKIQPKYLEEIQGRNKATLKFAEDNVGTLAGFYAINLLSPADFKKEMVDYSDKIKDKIKGNPMVDDFLNKMATIKKLDIGLPAPDFELNDVNDKPVKLSDFKGKYLMVDFWASWCGPCRNENPNVVAAYNQFKGKNFTILGVSLDRQGGKDQWLAAIAKDKLTWTHVSDLKYWDSKVVPLYAIEGIPANYLLDPKGNIIAKNLYGEELTAFLSKTLQ
jgi:peroxiredoxin